MPGRVVGDPPVYFPSVTEVLAACGLGPDYSRVPAATLDHARLRGRAVHAAIAYDLAGELEEGTIHPEVAGGLAAARRFVAESGFKAGLIEPEWVHPSWHFLGHPDAIGRLNGAEVGVDWKYNSFDAWATPIQLAGYNLLAAVNSSDEPLDHWLVVELHADGSYRPVPIDPRPQEQRFLAALVVFEGLKERERS